MLLVGDFANEVVVLIVRYNSEVCIRIEKLALKVDAVVDQRLTSNVIAVNKEGTAAF